MLKTLLIAVSMSLASTSAAQDYAVWDISPREGASFGSEIDWYRVTAGAFLDDGRVAVADAGNRRIVVLSRAGGAERSIGRRGYGPGEFQWVEKLFLVADTLYAYDPALRRVTLVGTGGELIRTEPLPSHNGRPTVLVDLPSSDEWLLRTEENVVSTRSEVVLTTTTLLTFRPSGGTLTEIARVPFRRRSFLLQDHGYTTYRLPFFGSARMASAPTGVALAPLDGRGIRLGSPKRGWAEIVLPVPFREFDVKAIVAYRDSLLDRAQQCGICSPDTADRIRAAYDNLDPPQHSPVVRRLLRGGDHIWVQENSSQRDGAARWFVIDPARVEIVAVVMVPPFAEVLAGEGRAVLLLERDTLGVERLRVAELNERTRH